MTATKAAPALDEILATLQKAYRKPKIHESTDAMEQLLYAVLMKWYPAAKCEAVIQAFRQEFVDWNELRVSHVTEIEPVLQRLELEDVHPPSHAVREALVGFHLQRNDLEPEFLNEMSAEERERFWSAVPTLDAAMIHYLALSREPAGTIVHQVDLARVAQRLGLIGKSSSSKKTVKDLEDLGAELDRLQLQLGLVRIGIETCDARNPACDLCKLASFCPMSEKVIAEKKQAEKKAAEARAAEARAAEAARLAAEKVAAKEREKAEKLAAKEAAIAAKEKAKADAEHAKQEKLKAAEKAKADKKAADEKAKAAAEKKKAEEKAREDKKAREAAAKAEKKAAEKLAAEKKAADKKAAEKKAAEKKAAEKKAGAAHAAKKSDGAKKSSGAKKSGSKKR
ncbi:MAG: hypothetical protein IPN34_00235 [Planctomycetes bacterium]|nr:hypothetical protein [Planctomycetota bacterium]